MSSRSAEPPVDPLLVDTDGHAELLLGNEAIVRGALEMGVAFASGYPGTPSSEITDSLARVAVARGIVFEYSVNEKVALETAFGASLAGARAICAMKHLGLMYAGDPLSTIPYVGAVGGLVIVSAADPSCLTSPNEQDQRHLGPMLHLPVLDPSTPQEALGMARFAFELSEKSSLPVLLRPTTRVCHTRANVRYGRLAEPVVKGFARDPQRFVPVPRNARRLRRTLLERVEIARSLASATEFIRRAGSGPLGIVASGAPAATCADLLEENGLMGRVTLMTMGVTYPLPVGRLLEFLRAFPRVLVVEELSPYLEDALRALCAENGVRTEIVGKRTGHLPVEFEYEPEVILRGVDQFLGNTAPPAPARPQSVVPRPPTLCPGCPHRSAFFAARAAFGDDQIYVNDIGCYTLGYGPPLDTADALLCMGAGFTLAAGMSRVTGARTAGFMGDSTFFHSGMPALLNAVKEDANVVAVILDNQVTGMTGFQESPFVTVEGGAPVRTVSIAAVARALGAPHVETVDPYDLPATIAAFERARDATGVSVVITERPCPVFIARETGRPIQAGIYEIDRARCKTCGREVSRMRCDLSISTRHQRQMARSRAIECVKSDAPSQIAPCATQCPIGLCIQGYASQIAAGQYREAFELIMSRCPLPESVCRVCNRVCERVCVRRDVDEPVAVNDLKRFVVDWAARGRVRYDPPLEPPNGKKIAVVGAGPSGLAAAHDLALRGYAVTILDAEERQGGLLRTGIPPYRLPRGALDRDIERIAALGVSFQGGRALGRDFQLKDLLESGFDTVYLALGAQRGLLLDLAGGEGAGLPVTVDALAYLRATNLGSAIETGRRVAVVGGGNAAIDAARTARRAGAECVTIVYRRRREDMPAIEAEIDAAEREGIELRAQLQPVAIRRGAGGGLVCVRTEPGTPDASGRSKPIAVAGSEEVIPADQIVAAIGQATDPAWLRDRDPAPACTGEGLPVVDPETRRTSHPRIFAGGDMTGGDRTVTGAIAEGQRAAWGIDCSLRGREQADHRPPPPLVTAPLPAKGLTARRASWTGRHRPEEIDPAARTRGFDEVTGVFTEAQARAEAARCMICGLCGNCNSCIDLLGCPAFFMADGAVQIDSTLCNGCGVCAAICPNGAIRKKA